MWLQRVWNWVRRPKRDPNVFVYHDGHKTRRADIHDLSVVLAADDRWDKSLTDLRDLEQLRLQVLALLDKGVPAPLADRVFHDWNRCVGTIVQLLREKMKLPTVEEGGLSSAAVMLLFGELLKRFAAMEERHCFLSLLPARQANSPTASTENNNSSSTCPASESDSPKNNS